MIIIGHILHPPLSPTWPVYRYVHVCRGNPLGNPFRIGEDGTRAEVIAKYRDWLPPAYERDEVVRRAIDQLVDHLAHDERPLVLLCYCHPLPCHAAVIAEFVEAKFNAMMADYARSYDEQEKET